MAFLFKGQRIKDELFQNNCYWNLSGDKKFLGYQDIAKWAMTKGKEQLDGKLTLVYADPMLNDTSTVNIINPNKLAGLSIFNPMALSPLVDAGFDIGAVEQQTDN